MRSVLAVLVIASIVGCKGKPSHKPPPQNLNQLDPVTNKPTKPVSPEAPDIVLPHGTGAPPVKTTEAIPLKTLLALQSATWKGFQREPHAINPERGMEVRHITEDRPKIAATITVAPCSANAVIGPCTAMDLAAWKAREADLRKMIPEELRDDNDTKFEVGTVKFHTVDLIYTYQLAQATGTATKGSAAGQQYIAYSYAYTLYYNDGHNQIRVVAEFKDDAMPTAAEMTKVVARVDLEATADAFFDAFTAVW